MKRDKERQRRQKETKGDKGRQKETKGDKKDEEDKKRLIRQKNKRTKENFAAM